MNSPPNTRERMMELLCDRALVGLDPAEEQELRALLAAFRGPDAGVLDDTAAVIALSQMAVGEAMPAHVAARAMAAAGLSVPGHGAQSAIPPVAPPSAGFGTAGAALGPSHAMPGHGSQGGSAQPFGGPGPQPSAPPMRPAFGHGSAPSRPGAQVVPMAPRRSRARAALPWLAAAACLALAVGAWWPRPRAELLQAHIEVPAAPTVTVDALEARQALLRDAPDTVTVPWTATADAAAKAASGDVVWSNAQQKGYMRFKGLEANDPKLSQYQLWIFDEAQDKRFPVDGGVFDVDPATGDVVVAIDAKLRVAKPTLFAVTVERPGGVVVSKRERIVLTASPG